LFDYAVGNEDILGGESIILYKKNNSKNEKAAIEKFSKRFTVIAYDNFSDVDSHLKKHGAHLMYMIKSGKNDGLFSRAIPTMVHAVFPTNPSQAHGASYAYVSEWLSRRCSANQIPCVPHMVKLPNTDEDIRHQLGISKTDKVIGSYGGRFNFDIPSAHLAVKELVNSRSNLKFIFMNTEPFTDHPNAIFLPGTTDLYYKVKFINSCDAMLHARRLGESFGLACAEFSIRNKPIITYRYNKHTHHHDVLGDKALYFSNKESLVKIIDSIDPIAIKKNNWDCYSEKYNQTKVMGLFDKHLIYPALKNIRMDKPNVKIDANSIAAYFELKLSMFFNSRLYPKPITFPKS
jgi:hypothetical protein